MATDKYILDADGNPVPEPDLMKWAMWLETDPLQRRVAYDNVGDCEISTVFLGLDFGIAHILHPEGGFKPVLWETIVFLTESDEPRAAIKFLRRYTSKAAALKGHARVLRWATKRWAQIEQLKEMAAKESA